MIILDYNQVAISNLFAQTGKMGQDTFDEDITRHMILNTIRRIRTKFKAQYGELVIASDARYSWRKDVYPYYKANRKKMRDTSTVDWDLVHETMNKIRKELEEFFPYKIIYVEKAEADDIIGTLANRFGSYLNTGEPVLIVSADKDFIQLQKYGNVKQYDPIRDKYVTHNDPVLYLKEHLMKGDRGDGVPNMLSKDDCFINGRQRPCRQKFIDASLFDNKGLAVQSFKWDDAELNRGYHRNRIMIDLDNTPSAIRDEINEAFDAPAKSRGKLFNYFVKYRLRNLINSIDEF